MFRRSVRITCLLIGLLATAGVAYRILHDEDVLGRERQRAAAGQAAISQASELLLDVRASLHAYVAAGQGLPFWADPFHREPNAINHWDDGRGVYFDDPNGHVLEVITRPYGSGGRDARHPNPLLGLGRRG